MKEEEEEEEEKKEEEGKKLIEKVGVTKRKAYKI